MAVLDRNKKGTVHRAKALFPPQIMPLPEIHIAEQEAEHAGPDVLPIVPEPENYAEVLQMLTVLCNGGFAEKRSALATQNTSTFAVIREAEMALMAAVGSHDPRQTLNAEDRTYVHTLLQNMGCTPRRNSVREYMLGMGSKLRAIASL
ncbi:hypothetical protein GX553_01820 [Candidatus Peribacteria bacterium]|nr:hypothetical protein [Candidatus Peribacteria bacterium]